jgi:four helix bundle protein
MSTKLTRFEDMQVWQDSQDFAVIVYATTKSFPGDELYALTSQMRRAASSISANIAEGFGRKSQKDTAHFYKIAYGSLLETKNFVYLSRRLNYISVESEIQLIESSEQLQKQINAILKYFKNHE